MVGLGRFELPTPRLSSVCSDQLSYKPPFGSSFKSVEASSALPQSKDRYEMRIFKLDLSFFTCHLALEREPLDRRLKRFSTCGTSCEGLCNFLRKEVIQPQVPLRLPCYDFTPSHQPHLRRRPPCEEVSLMRLLVESAPMV